MKTKTVNSEIKTVKGAYTISPLLRAEFEKEIVQFSKSLISFMNGDSVNMFGSVIKAPMPHGNITSIVNKYNGLAVNELCGQNVPRVRAKSVAAHVINKTLEELMLNIER